jgi:hypothetical protein
MNITILRHNVANLLLRGACRVAHFIHGPLDPEKLYTTKPLSEHRVGKGPRRAGGHRLFDWVGQRREPPPARPGVSSIDEPAYPHEHTQFEKYLEKEAECAP